jgi:F-type H+-transporting ATPase subunit c
MQHLTSSQWHPFHHSFQSNSSSLSLPISIPQSHHTPQTTTPIPQQLTPTPGLPQTAARKASPFQASKRAQVSQILKATQTRQSRPYSSEIASAMVQVSQNMGMGSAAIGLGGAGIGIGMVFAALIMAVARNPSMRGQLFSYAILGFAFVEAIGLFDLMVAMMCKYV